MLTVGVSDGEGLVLDLEERSQGDREVGEIPPIVRARRMDGLLDGASRPVWNIDEEKGRFFSRLLDVNTRLRVSDAGLDELDNPGFRKGELESCELVPSLVLGNGESALRLDLPLRLLLFQPVYKLRGLLHVQIVLRKGGCGLSKETRVMRFSLLVYLVLLCTFSALAEDVIVQTSLGDIRVHLEDEKAPITCKNFLKYVDRGLFTNARFHRTVTLKPDNQPQNRVKIEVIQAGLDPALEKKALPPIPLERTSKTGLSHKDGTISMARLEPDTASSEFFICLGAQPELDFAGKRNPDGQGFAAFGRVTEGMDVVRRIHRSKASEQSLEPPIIIQSVRRVR